MYLRIGERERVIDTIVDHVDGHVPVGCGCINLTFEDGLELARIASRAGGRRVYLRMKPGWWSLAGYGRR